MKAKSRAILDDMRPEYDFDYSTAVRGKYYRRLLKEGANVVVLEPDVAKAFRSSAAVNEALRSLLQMSEAARRLTSRSSGRAPGARPLRLPWMAGDAKSAEWHSNSRTILAMLVVSHEHLDVTFRAYQAQVLRT
jgi:hypothetical protein